MSALNAAELLREAEELEIAAAELRERAAEMAAQEREDALADALALYDGPLTRRASALSQDYNRYLGTGMAARELAAHGRRLAEAPGASQARRLAQRRKPQGAEDFRPCAKMQSRSVVIA